VGTQSRTAEAMRAFAALCAMMRTEAGQKAHPLMRLKQSCTTDLASSPRCLYRLVRLALAHSCE
jgi:hypothetical protein